MSTCCTCKYGHGSSRSVVRQIGGRIPLDTGRRIHVQVPQYSESPQAEHRYNTAGLTLASYFKHPDHRVTGRLFSGEWEEGMEWDGGSDDSGMDTILDGEDDEEPQTEEKQETMEKISALESELARLKAQIAVYALSEVSNIPTAPPAPPPPPPMAPPPPPTASTPAPQPRVPLSSRGGRQREPATPVNPNFSHVLRDLGSVKLRSVPSIVRSPGGTPMKKRDQDSQEPASTDPGAVIAQALRRKFAHNVFQDSPDKENLLDKSSDSSASGFDSPAGKLFN